MLRNIFTSAPSTLCDPAEPAPSPATPSAPPAAPTDPSIDDALLAILVAPPRAVDTIAVAYARKEQGLYALLSTLDVAASRTLRARLSSDPSPSDPLTTAFHRLTADRRGRLLTFLADVRRRHATRGRR
jgi:hypothetical protein